MSHAAVDLCVKSSDDLARKYRSVRVSIERIGPTQAGIYLKTNGKNRKLNELHVARLRDAMVAGDWWLNGETVIFGVDGALLDGQHRLHAIIKSGAVVDVLVVRGIDEEAFRTLDGGRTRTTADVMSCDGEKNAHKVVAAVQAIVSFVDSGGTVFHVAGGRKATPLLTSRLLSVYPQVRDSVAAMSRNQLFRNQQATMLHFLFSLVDSEVADDFASVLADGHPDVGRPFMVFREHLINTPHRSDLRRSYAAKAIKAFNAEMAGERPKMFKFSPGDHVPVIVGLNYSKLNAVVG
jgi:hypothetical protein